MSEFTNISGALDEHLALLPIGNDKVTNGNFDTDTDWAKTDPSLTIAGGVAHWAGGVATVTLSQTKPLILGVQVLVTFTISNYVSGNMLPYAGSGGAGTPVNGNGTYSEVLTVTGDVVTYMQGTGIFEGDLDNVSIFALSDAPVAWENDIYKPIKGTLYLRPTLLPGDTVGATLSSGGTDEHVGVYQIDVFAEATKGKKAAIVMADLIADRFKPVTEMAYGGVTVRAVSVSRGAGVTESGWYKIPVTVRYLAFTTKR